MANEQSPWAIETRIVQVTERVNALIGRMDDLVRRMERNEQTISLLAVLPTQIAGIKEDVIAVRHDMEAQGQSWREQSQWFESFKRTAEQTQEQRVSSIKASMFTFLGFGVSFVLFVLGVLAQAIIKGMH